MITIHEFDHSGVSYRIRETKLASGAVYRKIYQLIPDDFGNQYWEESEVELLPLIYSFAVPHMKKISEEEYS